MRKLWFAVLATMAVAAMSSGAERAQASCINVVVWHDTAYFGFSSLPKLSDVRAGSALSGAVVPDCADTGGPPGSPSHVGARRIAGVSPDVAIESNGQVLVSSGYLPLTRSFPLKQRDTPSVNETGNCVAGRSRVIDGTADSVLYGVSVRRPSGGLETLFVDSNTKVVGLHRHGVAFVGRGQRVHIVAVPCGTRLVARRITAAGPIVGQATASQVLRDDWDGASWSFPWRVVWIGALLATAAVGAWALHRRVD
jgi:hypothetical protein